VVHSSNRFLARMLALFLLFSSSNAQAPCVTWVISNLTNYPNAVNDLTACFANVTYSYDPNTGALVTNVAGYCNADCPSLLAEAIKLTVELNCSEDVVNTVASVSTSLCDPTDKECSLANQACVNVTADDFFCANIVANTTLTCSIETIGFPCSPANKEYSAICLFDYDTDTVQCVNLYFPTVELSPDDLPDVYFYLGQTFCQKSGNQYCVDLVYADYDPTCEDVATWGCCAGTYYDLVEHCENPATDTITSLYTACPANGSIIDWTTRCGGVSGAGCCGPRTEVCSLSGATGVVPSVMLIAILALWKLLA